MIPFFTQLVTDPVVIEKADSVKSTFSQLVENLSSMSAQDLLKTVANGTVSIALKIVIALVIFWIGRWLIRRVRKIMDRIMTRRNVDVSLRAFLISLVTITMMLFLIIITIGILGIDTTSFIALFASAGLAIGMALSGTLQNFAGGVIILLFRPFRVGDFIEAQGQSGTVKEIQLIHTLLNTPDNKTILLPNGPVSTGIINNYSREPRRRVDWTFGIAYGDDYDVARATIAELLAADERVAKDPAPFIALSTLADSSVNIVVRAWVDSSEYWNVYFDMNERVYKVFGTKGLNIPFPQMDVHLYKEKEA
ncbi:mechanosensitive ion channel domain-containing protein [uncultured Rikenella sp.]|uniref:mechanosensitive ion channel family protein n=1 Tax=uncultured Rikenella sp. TaxID=368003 RepID=UPI0025EA16BE|nr:mechanosensitive ion channel domain-containing protein [uncultured Rikenella sp.]